MKKWFLVAMLFICSVLLVRKRQLPKRRARSQIPLIIATL